VNRRRRGPGGPRRGRLGTRGQTLQDYAVGISLFLITLSAVLAGLLGFTSPLTAGVSAEDVSQSQRVTTAIVQNLSTGSQPNQLDASRTSSTLDRPATQLRTRWGIETTTSLNVSVTALNGTAILQRGGRKLTAGSTARNESTATSSRVVTFDDGTCDPSCRLVVRTW
jgi:hypothetical protein